ncbi:hypothetical protein DB30_03109 [Enhygromyxa salina]|uniref:Uncharacterized protein n=1 Tax=Enhygromyxa salina TaxID=215803 RepID=A0A0C2CPG9_9BACT|nr:hypothetical protein DB30_03109 [Enhygromyxa salina]
MQRWDGDHGKDAENRDHDHQLDERETLGVLELLHVDDLFHVFVLSFVGVSA